VTRADDAPERTWQIRRERHQPTLMVWGKSDPFGSPDSGRSVTALMLRAELVVVGLGRLPWWDELDECVRLVRAFVTPSD